MELTPILMFKLCWLYIQYQYDVHSVMTKEDNYKKNKAIEIILIDIRHNTTLQMNAKV